MKSSAHDMLTCRVRQRTETYDGLAVLNNLSRSFGE